MNTSPTISPDGTTAARNAAAFYLVPDAGLLLVAGDDGVDFLNRQTTNDVRLLSATRSVVTVLTSPTARIEDVLWLLELPDGIGALTLAGRGQRTRRSLAGKIFFMDRVTVTDASAGYSQFDIMGPDCPAVLGTLGVTQPPEPGAVVVHTLQGEFLYIAGGLGVGLGGYRLLAPAAAASSLAAVLASAGAAELDPAGYEVLRVENGRPGPAGELTDEYNPLEMRLDHAISQTKGCYTGQEIIARQITYEKVTRQLAGLRLDQPVAAGCRVLEAGKPVGVVTSAVQSPQFGPIALAILKRPLFEPGIVLTVQIEGGETSDRGLVPAVTAALPFA